jgi:hypothetical protein
MPSTRKKKQDPKRVSAQKHEIAYTGRKVAKAAGTSRSAGKKAVRGAKKKTGSVSRPKVERRARKIASA